MLPHSLALVDDDADFSGYLAEFLTGLGVSVSSFADSDDLLTSDGAFEHEFYVVDLMLPGINGLDLLRLLRKRTNAGILVVSGKLGSDVFGQVIEAGADMLLVKPATFEQILTGIRAIYRRSGRGGSQQEVWVLDAAHATLRAPDGAVIELSPTDLQVMESLLEHPGQTVGRDELTRRLGLDAEDPNALHATIYRLRRRIERATPALVPLQSRSRQGYLFKAELRRA